MAHQVKIPAFGESINSASIGRWHKADGEAVQKGETIATLDTDKVSSELEAEVSGTLKILVPEGDEVAIGALIAEIEEGAAASPSAPATPAPGKPANSGPAAPAAGESGAGREIKIKVPPFGESITSSNVAQWHKRDGEAVAKGEILVTLETDKVSSELQAEEGGALKILVPEGTEVDIGTLIGTIAVGVGGAPAPQEEVPTPAPVSPPAPASPSPPAPVSTSASPASPAAEPAKLKPDFTVVPGSPQREAAVPAESDGRTTRKRMSPLRRKIATQLVAAQQTAAILTTFNEADMSAVMKLRKSVQEDFVKKHGLKLGFMSFFVKAVVQALKAVPSVNARIDGDDLVLNHFFDIGIAVGTEKGLVVPVVRDADQKSFAEIEQDILDYALRARDGKIQLEDLRGGCFTISNGGIYGSLLSTPIVNPPQSGILGMHTIQQRPVAVDGKVEIRPMMYLALSYDHRVVDGQGAVSFLIKIVDSIENPTRLMLEI